MESHISKAQFIQELKSREAGIVEIFNQPRYRQSFRPAELEQAVYSYLVRPAKRFRPGLLLFSCGAVGGREEQAVYAAAAVEVYHTWTLVHDDVIDNDPLRRGSPTVHEQFRRRGLELGYSSGDAEALGRNMAILAGDLQHAWSVRLLLDSAELGVPLPVLIDLAHRLEVEVTNELLAGEALDVLFAKRPIGELQEAEILEMLELKTGVLYQFAGMAGAAIGLAQPPTGNELIQGIGRFTRRCGTAFQLQDDILGITGNEQVLGKAVGSDIREGKRTLIVLHAYHEADITDREFLETWLGNPAAGPAEIGRINRILIDNGGIEYTRTLAAEIVAAAVDELKPLTDSHYKELLLTWARYVVERDF